MARNGGDRDGRRSDSDEDWKRERRGRDSGSDDERNDFDRIMWVNLGRAGLKADEQSFRESFRRWDDYTVNGWSEEKMNYMGQEGKVIENWEDKTVQIRFDDGAIFDFPMESVEWGNMGREERGGKSDDSSDRENRRRGSDSDDRRERRGGSSDEENRQRDQWDREEGGFMDGLPNAMQLWDNHAVEKPWEGMQRFEFENAYRSVHNAELNDEEIEGGWKGCDEDGDMMLHFKEFRRCYIEYRHMRAVNDFWNRYSSQDSLNMDEFMSGVREMDDNMPAAEMQGYFTRGDMNGDQLIDRGEFEAMYWEQV